MRLAPGLLIVALALLTACGFRLRGDVPLSPTMREAWIEAPDRQSPFYRALVASIVAAGGRLASDADSASAVVSIRRDETGERVLSVSARNTPREFEVYYTVEYSATIGGADALAPQSLTQIRDYSYDETAVLAKEEEKRDITEALAQDLAALVLRQLNAL